MNLYFFSSNTLGYGSMQYLYFLKSIKQHLPQTEIETIEPIEKNKKLDINLSIDLRRFYGKSKVIALLKYLCLIFISYFKNIVLVSTYPSNLFNYFSKKTILITYYYEIWDELADTKNSLEYFNKVEYVLAPQEDRLEIAKEIYPNAKYFLVENCKELTLQQAIEKDFENKVLLYQGQINDTSNAKEFLDLIEVLENIKIEIAGPVEEKYLNRLNKICDRKKSITYHGYLTSEELNHLRSKCNIGLITWMDDTLTTKYACPSKLYDYISEGIFVVSFPNYSVRKFNDKYQFGIVSDSVEKLKNQIESLCSSDLQNKYNHNIGLYNSILNYEYQIKDFIDELSKSI